MAIETEIVCTWTDRERHTKGDREMISEEGKNNSDRVCY